MKPLGSKWNTDRDMVRVEHVDPILHTCPLQMSNKNCMFRKQNYEQYLRNITSIRHLQSEMDEVVES